MVAGYELFLDKRIVKFKRIMNMIKRHYFWLNIKELVHHIPHKNTKLIENKTIVSLV